MKSGSLDENKFLHIKLNFCQMPSECVYYQARAREPFSEFAFVFFSLGKLKNKPTTTIGMRKGQRDKNEMTEGMNFIFNDDANERTNVWLHSHFNF